MRLRTGDGDASDPAGVRTVAPTRERRRAVLVVLAPVVLAVTWALLTAPYAAPDEPAHVARAAAVVRGDWLARETPADDGGYGLQRVPADVAAVATVHECFAFQPRVDASCVPHQRAGRRLVTLRTPAAFAAPSYSVLVGAPQLVLPERPALYATRLVAAVESGLLVGVALLAMASLQSALGVLAIAVSATPLTFHLAGAVSPSGLEITSGIAAWALALAALRLDEPPRWMRIGLPVALAVLALVRPFGPAWVVAVVVAALWLGPADRRRARLRARWVRVTGVVAAVASLASLAWTAVGQPLVAQPGDRPAGQSVLERFADSAGYVDFYFKSTIGTLGWLDTHVGVGVYYLWAGALATVVLVGLAAATRPAVLIVAIGAGGLITPALGAVQSADFGVVLHGRYTLPVLVGVPILAAAGARLPSDADALVRRLVVLWIVVIAGLHAVAGLTALRRWAVGVDGPVWFFGSSTWSPPLGSALTAVLLIAASAVWGAALLLAAAPGRSGRVAA